MKNTSQKLSSVTLALVLLAGCSSRPQSPTTEMNFDRAPASSSVTNYTFSPSVHGPFRNGATLASPRWPQWSHEHWVWENEGTEDSASTLVEDYLSRDIPVSAVIIDRPWDTTPSTFIPDPNLYPNMEQLIHDFHEKNVKVILWSVPILNEGAPEFAMAKSKNYFVNKGRTVKWWGGRGALLDYKNAEAVTWWHSRMDNVLKMGLDGWKLDAADPYIIFADAKSEFLGNAAALTGVLKINPFPMKLWKDYRKSYYTDYWKYSTESTGKKFMITARPIDMLEGTNFQYEFVPREVSFAGWVGDQEGNWKGMQKAIDIMKASANENFISFGSDVGGFKHFKGEPENGQREKELFVRWVQMGAFNSVFENGGNGEHRPWVYGQDVEDIYRKFTKIHQSLVPYIYSSAAWADENKHSVYVNIEKIGVKPAKSRYWDYLLGPNLFVATLDEANANREIRFPKGEWIPWFDTHMVVPGKMKKTFNLDEYPVYIRSGSILPILNAESNTLTAWIFPNPKEAYSQFPIYYESKKGGMLGYTLTGSKMQVKVTNVSNLGNLKINNALVKKAVMNGSDLSIQNVAGDSVIEVTGCTLNCVITLSL